MKSISAANDLNQEIIKAIIIITVDRCLDIANALAMGEG